jgi:hypothetical protein
MHAWTNVKGKIGRLPIGAIFLQSAIRESIASGYKFESLVSHALVCWRCGASLAALSLPLRRLDVCKACNAELHVCKMCVEYDTSYAKHCKEPTAEEVRKKDEANFCDHFKPKAGAYVPKNEAEIAKSKSALNDLFRK